MNYLLPILTLVFCFSCGNAESELAETSVKTASLTAKPVERSTLPTEDAPKSIAVETEDIASMQVQPKNTAIKEKGIASMEVQPTKLEQQKKPFKAPVERDGTRTDADVPTTQTTPTPVKIAPPPIEKEVEKPVVTTSDHAAWNALLSTYVTSSGAVNYSGLKKNEGKLDAYLAELAKASPGSGWGRNEAMAYWINAYNAFTVKLILKNWPVKSIMDLHGGKPWDVKWIELAGKTYSLNGIEHGILRPIYKDPRIHFAVNCAAQSCPPIHNRAFTAANLSGKLESLTNSFINNSTYNEIGATEVKVSKIFDWYGKDFGNVKDYLNKYSAATIAVETPIEFKEYDWTLNGK